MFSAATMRAFEEAVDKLASVRVLVVGDVLRISPEAPVPVVLQKRRGAALGGAGNVALNIAAYGAKVALVGLIGVDSAAREVAEIATQASILADLVADTSRATTVKTRVIAQHQQMLRIDEETTHAPVGDVRDRMLAAVESHLDDVDIVVLSDYAKGAFAGGVASDVITAARKRGLRVLVDPKSEDFNVYRGASLVSPNVRELADAVGVRAVDDESAVAACLRALERFAIDAVLLTRSEQGMTLVTRGTDPVHVRSQALEVFDVTGAGDTVIATVAAACATGLSLPDAIRMGNAAAGVAVGRRGTVTVSPMELKRAIGLTSLHRPMPLAEAKEIAAGARNSGRVIGFTNGVFDLLHSGHIQSLEQAAGHCDMLFVGVNSDDSVRRLKGPDRPVQSHETRARVLAALDVVDIAVVFDEDTPLELIRALEPDVIFKGQDYREDQVVGADLVKARGGRVVLLPLIPGVSTTATVQRLRGAG